MATDARTLDDAALRREVDAANLGDRRALERVVEAVQDSIYRLALRMLDRPADAEDATQEILIRIVTRLSGYRGTAQVRTWVYRVAANHLLDVRRQRAADRVTSFEDFGRSLEAGLAAQVPGPSDPLVIEEARLVCTQGMLQCLDREHRLAYILGEVMELASADASAVLEIGDAAYRKRLERSRAQMEEFASKRCGVVERSAACRCEKQVGPLVAHGLVVPERLVLAKHPRLRAQLQSIDDVKSAAQLMRSHPEYAAPESFVRGLRAVLASPRGPS